MKTANPYPLLFTPVYQDYVWGGTRLATEYARGGAPARCAESWEIADRPEGMSCVANGPLAGVTLHALLEAWGQKLAGANYTGGPFPLLIKLIDAAQSLSVQVHPNDRNAAALGGEAKAECWHVLANAPDARLYAGFETRTDPDAFTRLVSEGRVDSVLHAIPARPHDTLFVPGGRIHAIGAGCLLLEVQQNSNTTYRVYDWGRVGDDGKPRDLHVEQALRAIEWDDIRPTAREPRHLHTPGPNARWELISSDVFRLERIALAEAETVRPDPASFTVIFVESARVDITCGGIREVVPAGRSCLIPAAAASYTLHPSAPSSSVIAIRAG